MDSREEMNDTIQDRQMNRRQTSGVFQTRDVNYSLVVHIVAVTRSLGV